MERARESEQLQVSENLQQLQQNDLQERIKKKERLLEQKELLIAETIDALSAEVELKNPLEFEKSLSSVPAAVFQSASRAIDGNLPSPSQVTTNSTWVAVVRNRLCIWLELKNCSSDRSFVDVRAYPVFDCNQIQNLALTTSHIYTYSLHPMPYTLWEPTKKALLVLTMDRPVVCDNVEFHVIMNWSSGVVSGHVGLQPALEPLKWKTFEAEIAQLKYNLSTVPHFPSVDACLKFCEPHEHLSFDDLIAIVSKNQAGRTETDVTLAIETLKQKLSPSEVMVTVKDECSAFSTMDTKRMLNAPQV